MSGPAPDTALGRLQRDIERTPVMQRDELLALLPIAQQSEDSPAKRAADERIVRGNARLVLKMARHRAQITHTLRLEDLIAVGLAGLARAIETFDPEQSEFSTYATQWLRQSINREVANIDRAIRIPVHLLDATRYPFRRARPNS